jgi:hypothetical protein
MVSSGVPQCNLAEAPPLSQLPGGYRPPCMTQIDRQKLAGSGMSVADCFRPIADVRGSRQTEA